MCILVSNNPNEPSWKFQIYSFLIPQCIIGWSGKRSSMSCFMTWMSSGLENATINWLTDFCTENKIYHKTLILWTNKRLKKWQAYMYPLKRIRFPKTQVLFIPQNTSASSVFEAISIHEVKLFTNRSSLSSD